MKRERPMTVDAMACGFEQWIRAAGLLYARTRTNGFDRRQPGMPDFLVLGGSGSTPGVAVWLRQSENRKVSPSLAACSERLHASGWRTCIAYSIDEARTEVVRAGCIDTKQREAENGRTGGTKHV